MATYGSAHTLLRPKSSLIARASINHFSNSFHYPEWAKTAKHNLTKIGMINPKKLNMITITLYSSITINNKPHSKIIFFNSNTRIYIVRKKSLSQSFGVSPFWQQIPVVIDPL